MPTPATDVIGKAVKLLKDAGYVRFPAATTMLSWLNDGLLELVKLDPTIGITTHAVSMVAGVKQSVTGLLIEKFAYFKPVAISFLNKALPGWEAHAASATVLFVAYDPLTPKEYWVYPPQPTGTSATMMLSEVLPLTALTTINDNLPCNDLYGPALIDYLCYRCYQSEMDAASMARSDLFFSAFAGKVAGYKKPAANSKPAGEVQQ